MAIALPEIPGQKFLSFLVDCANTARAIRDGSGDLRFVEINALQNNHGYLRASLVEMQQQAQINATLTLDYLRSRAPDGPVNLAGWGTAAANLDTAMTAWGGAVLATARSLSATQLIGIQSRQLRGQTVQTIEASDAIPAAAGGDVLRASSQLAAVITVLEALGA